MTRRTLVDKEMLVAQAGRLDLDRVRAGAQHLLDDAGRAELEDLVRAYYTS